MRAEDQRYRNQMQVEIMKMSSLGTTQQSGPLIAIVEKQDEIDKKNMARLEEIIKQYGWPGRSLVGEEAANTGFLILQHADLTVQKKYFPLVKEGARKGEVRPGDAAMLEDRMLMNEGKKQIYGSAVQSGPETGGKLVLHPIEDEEHVDERRAAVGLIVSRVLEGIRVGIQETDKAVRRSPKRESEILGGWSSCGVSRIVVPAKAGIQPGFRFALRLAGMTQVCYRPEPSARISDTR